jgi:septum formation protein
VTSEARAPRLVLASASPRRAHILETLGIPFRVVASAVDESLLSDETGEAAVERLARRKAAFVAEAGVRAQAEGQEQASKPDGPLPVLAADTEVLCLGRVLGKPASEQGALEMLELLAGRAHDVVTGVCVAHRGVLLSGVERSIVTLAPMTEAERRWYVATGEPLDKAGGYHVDGKGALFIESVAGSPSNVAGLPVRLVRRLFREAGLDLF